MKLGYWLTGPFRLMVSVKLTATEHLHEQGRWDKCARLFFHNPGNIGASERIHIPGLRTPLYLYQAFGVFVMFEMELFQGGGYNADDMGLGKVHCTPDSLIFRA